MEGFLRPIGLSDIIQEKSGAVISFDCPDCGATLHAPDEYAGGSATCKVCAARVRIPPMQGDNVRQDTPSQTGAEEDTDEAKPVSTPGVELQHAVNSLSATSPFVRRRSPSSSRVIVTLIIAMIAVTFAFLAAFVAWRVHGQRNEAYIAKRLAEATSLIDQQEFRRANVVLEELSDRKLPSATREEVDILRASIANEVKEICRRDAVAARSKEEAREQSRRRAMTQRRDEKEAERVRRAENLVQFGGAMGGILIAFGLFMLACLLIGIGQLFIAFRDIAINSYLATNADAQNTARTRAAPGQPAPRYRFIPLLALVFYVVAALQTISAVVIALIVLWNL